MFEASYKGEEYNKFEYRFSVTLIDPCDTAVLTIDPTIIPSTVIDYSLGAFVMSISFDEAKISSSVTDCPGYKFQFESQDGNLLNPDVFTQIREILKIYSEDPEMEGDYPLRVIVYFYSAFMTYANSATLDFTVKVHGEGEVTRPPLLVTSYKIDSTALLTLNFNHPLALPELAVQNVEDSS